MSKHLERDLEERDANLARQVIAGDDAIDQQDNRIEEECLKMLALHQPVAIDLRRITAVLKINTDLERMADLAMDIEERGPVSRRNVLHPRSGEAPADDRPDDRHGSGELGGLYQP
jgi:phosphate uptake regulator